MNAYEEAPDNAEHAALFAAVAVYRWGVYWQTFWGTKTGRRMLAECSAHIDTARRAGMLDEWGNIPPHMCSSPTHNERHGHYFRLGYSDTRQWAEDFTSSVNASADASFNTMAAWHERDNAREEKTSTTATLNRMAFEWVMSAATVPRSAPVVDCIRSACANDPTSPWAQYCTEKQARGGWGVSPLELFTDDMEERHAVLMRSRAGRLLRSTVPQFGTASLRDVVAVTSSAEWRTDVEKCAALTIADVIREREEGDAS